jgi:hypothetical protein
LTIELKAGRSNFVGGEFDCDRDKSETLGVVKLRALTALALVALAAKLTQLGPLTAAKFLVPNSDELTGVKPLTAVVALLDAFAKVCLKNEERPCEELPC